MNKIEKLKELLESTYTVHKLEEEVKTKLEMGYFPPTLEELLVNWNPTDSLLRWKKARIREAIGILKSML